MNNKLVSIILTGVIISLLVLSGPAGAVILGLAILDNEVQKGEIANVKITINTETNEQINVSDIDELIFTLNGPIKYNCKFDKNGNILSGCEGITIETSYSNCGYGYCYGYGIKEKLEFNISIDTSQYFAGTYQTNLEMKSGENSYSKEGDDIDINFINDEMKSCSLRGREGSLFVENNEQVYDKKNKLSFFVPLKKAKNGKGSLTSQDGERFVYSFNVKEVLENDEEHAVIWVTGNYRLDRKAEKPETSVIVLDKRIGNEKVQLIGENVNLDDMDITLMKGC